MISLQGRRCPLQASSVMSLCLIRGSLYRLPSSMRFGWLLFFMECPCISLSSCCSGKREKVKARPSLTCMSLKVLFLVTTTPLRLPQVKSKLGSTRRRCYSSWGESGNPDKLNFLFYNIYCSMKKTYDWSLKLHITITNSQRKIEIVASAHTNIHQLKIQIAKILNLPILDTHMELYYRGSRPMKSTSTLLQN